MEYILENEIPTAEKYQRFIPDLQRCISRIRSWSFEEI